MYYKVLVTDGMSYDLLLFLTDAPEEEIDIFFQQIKEAINNGDSTKDIFDNFKTQYLYKVLLDSEQETETREMAQCIGWDKAYDLSE